MKAKGTYRKGLSRRQIESYRHADEAGKRHVEGHLQDDFEQDALDGWMESGLSIAEGMHRADKRFRFKNHWLTASVIVLVTGGILLALLFSGNNVAPVSPPHAKEKVRLSIEQSDAVIETAIDTLTELPKERQIAAVTIKTTQQEIKKRPEEKAPITAEDFPVVLLEPLKIDEEIAPAKTSLRKLAKEIYLHDLKLIDYRQYRSKPPVVKTERIILTGTPANSEERGTSSDAETEITKVDIPYIDYIDKTMDYVNRGKWKQALQRLQLILVTYPDDLNAHFYAGLCSYNLQQYDNAKQHFASCLQLEYTNFNEEAAWYLAQSLLANGEKAAAKELFMKIRSQKGFYAKQAETFLKN